MVELQIKSTKGKKVFSIDTVDCKTVADVKKKLGEQDVDHGSAGAKLIAAGKLLKDTDAFNGDDFKSKTIVVIPSGQQTSTATSTKPSVGGAGATSTGGANATTGANATAGASSSGPAARNGSTTAARESILAGIRGQQSIPDSSGNNGSSGNNSNATSGEDAAVTQAVQNVANAAGIPAETVQRMLREMRDVVQRDVVQVFRNDVATQFPESAASGTDATGPASSAIGTATSATRTAGTRTDAVEGMLSNETASLLTPANMQRLEQYVITPEGRRTIRELFASVGIPNAEIAFGRAPRGRRPGQGAFPRAAPNGAGGTGVSSGTGAPGGTGGPAGARAGGNGGNPGTRRAGGLGLMGDVPDAEAIQDAMEDFLEDHNLTEEDLANGNFTIDEGGDIILNGEVLGNLEEYMAGGDWDEEDWGHGDWDDDDFRNEDFVVPPPGGDAWNVGFQAGFQAGNTAAAAGNNGDVLPEIDDEEEEEDDDMEGDDWDDEDGDMDDSDMEGSDVEMDWNDEEEEMSPEERHDIRTQCNTPHDEECIERLKVLAGFTPNVGGVMVLAPAVNEGNTTAAPAVNEGNTTAAQAVGNANSGAVAIATNAAENAGGNGQGNANSNAENSNTENSNTVGNSENSANGNNAPTTDPPVPRYLNPKSTTHPHIDEDSVILCYVQADKNEHVAANYVLDMLDENQDDDMDL